jgi:MFS family permease
VNVRSSFIDGAGIKLAPMAIGMLLSSPLAGIWADRHGLQNTGAVISIAFVLAVVTNSIPKDVLFAMLAATSVVGAGVSLLRPRHV